MNQNHVRMWNVLCWNVRGLNAVKKWDSVKNKVLQANCEIICLQETKIQNLDLAFLRKIFPPCFDDFLYVPSVGASGGVLTAWNSQLFSGTLRIISGFGIGVEFSSKFDDSSWTLVNIYGPCTPEGKREFIDWLKHIEIPINEDWIFMGDFNLYRCPENRNRIGADINDMFLFNSTISHMGLSKITLQGKKYTQSNMQQPPLLEKLDWVFTNNNWTLSFPEIACKVLTMEVSDHSPLVIIVSTSIPRANIFRFESHWLLRHDFQEIMTANWHCSDSVTDEAKRLTSKFKNLRGALKRWSSQFSNLKNIINNISLTHQFIDVLEEFRDLSLEEWNFRSIIRDKLLLLEQQRIYWKQRGAIKWATLGDAGTKFFHANATLKHRRNIINALKNENGELVTSHIEKESIIWNSFKQRIGQTEFNDLLFDLSTLIQRHDGLSHLEENFSIAEIDNVVKQLPNDKSPGPDGFSNDFIKKCWPTIKEDFYKLCWGFQNSSVCLQSINNSFITLSPKLRLHQLCQTTGPYPY